MESNGSFFTKYVTLVQSKYAQAMVNPTTLRVNAINRKKFLKDISDNWIVFNDAEWDEVDSAVFARKELVRKKVENDQKISRSYRSYNRRINNTSLLWIKGYTLLNKCSYKLSVIDKQFKYRLTNPKKSQQFKNVDRETELFYVADIGCGSGGFTEYILLRKGFYNTKSFGVSLSNSDPVSSSLKIWPFFLDLYYDGIGDILRSETRDGYVKFVLQGTQSQGVHLVVSDAVTTKAIHLPREFGDMKLFITQVLLGLKVLKDGGNAVFLWFSTFTLASSGIFFLLYNVFEEVSINKPIYTHQYNAERYFVCFNYNKAAGAQVVEHLEKVIQHWGDGIYLEECVPKDVIEADREFLRYFTEITDDLLRKQILFQELILRNERVNHLSQKERLLYEPNELNYIPKYFTSRTYQSLFDERREHHHTKFNNTDNFFLRTDNSNFWQNSIIMSVGNEASGYRKAGELTWQEYDFVGVPPGTILLVEKLKIENTFLVRDCGLLSYDDVSTLKYPQRMEAFKKFLLAIRPVTGKFYYYNFTYKCIFPVTLL